MYELGRSQGYHTGFEPGNRMGLVVEHGNQIRRGKRGGEVEKLSGQLGRHFEITITDVLSTQTLPFCGLTDLANY